MYDEEVTRLREVDGRASQAEEIVCAKALGQEEWWHVVGIKQTGTQGFWGQAVPDIMGL